MNIEGTVTISIQTFEELKKVAENGEKYRQELQGISEKVTELIEFDDEAYVARMKEIDKAGDMTDRQLKKVMSEALSLLKISVDAESLKKFLKKYIDDNVSENHCDFANATDAELRKIQLTIRS